MVNKLLTKVGSRGTRSSLVEIDKKSSPSPSSSRWGKSWRSGSRSGHSDKTLDPLCTTWRCIKDHPRCHTSSSVSQSHLSSRPSVSGCGLLANRSKFLEQKQSTLFFFFLSFSFSFYIVRARIFEHARVIRGFFFYFRGNRFSWKSVDPLERGINELEMMSSSSNIIRVLFWRNKREKRKKGSKGEVFWFINRIKYL